MDGIWMEWRDRVDIVIRHGPTTALSRSGDLGSYTEYFYEKRREKRKGRKDWEKKKKSKKKKKGILSIYLLYIHSHPLGPPHVPFTIELKYTHGKKSFFR